MAIAVTNSGTTSALSASPATVGAARTDGKTYVLALDLTPMAAGDVIVLTCEVKTLTGSTARVLFTQTWANAQSDANYQSIPVPAPYSVEFRLAQPAGTGRTIDYALMSL